MREGDTMGDLLLTMLFAFVSAYALCAQITSQCQKDGKSKLPFVSTIKCEVIKK